MRTWRELPDEKSVLFSPIGLRPVDDLTGKLPLGKVRAVLDAREPNGDWRATGVRPLVTQGGVIAYPALGRRRSPVGQPATRYRVRVEADHYIPGYRRDQDGIEFDAFPYDDANPPQSAPGMPQPLVLMPAPDYPFAGHLLVLRGIVVDAGGAPVRDAEVSIGTTRRTLSDARGCFALATPRPAAPTSIQVDAADLRSGRVGGATVPFPPGLVTSIQITIL
jgi:hypothetical protein